jgi:DNA-binding SARP family transcriptional activator
MSGAAATLRVQLLGPVQAWRGEAELGLGGPQRRAVLAMLAMRAHRGMSRNELIDGLWGQGLPANAVDSLHVCIVGLRRALEPGRAHRAPAQVLVTNGPGYRLNLQPGRLDTEELHNHLAQARLLTGDGDYASAARSLDAALGLWKGDSLAGITGPWADIERARLAELRQAAIGERIDVMLALGCHQEAIAELARLIREYPLQERFRAQMMLALYRCGRQADALAAFADARRLLAEQLGIDPGAELRRLHQQILRGDAALDLVAQGHRRAAPAGSDTAIRSSPSMSATVPRELPADVDTFIGRTAELAELDEVLATAAEPRRQAGGSATVISAVAGSAGIGKTTLALRWGHRTRDAFPDGDLYIDLRGYDPGEPLTAGDALARFLRSLGLADRDVPVDEEERAARYRSLLDGRRMLIVLDNAATTEQVRLLLPGVPSCVVLVTSRDSLAGLVARYGARRLELDLLPTTDATALLRALIGARAEADPVATAALAGQCARLPLALRVAAELATARPELPLAELVDELADEQRRLDLLDAGGDARTAVRGVFSWSCQHLPVDAARAFRLVSLHPGPDFDAYAAAALVGTTVEHAAGLLRKLAQAHLIQAADPGRYAMHDLLRAYARHLASSAPGAESQAALARLLGYYLATAAAAMDALVPAERDYRPHVTLAAAPLPPVATPASARAWLDSERDVLVRAVRYASGHGAPEHAMQVSAILQRYLLAGHYIDAVVIHRHASSAARQIGDRAAEAYALEHLGVIYNRLGRYREGAGCLKQALGLFREIADRRGEGFALTSLAGAERRYSCYPKAAALGRQALGLFLEIGDRLGEALARMEIGVAEWQQGAYRQAGVHFEQARVLYHAAGDTSNEAHALSNLGVINELLGRYPQAAENLHRALAVFRLLGQREGEATTLTDLGSVACRQGQYADAASYQEQALALSREIGERTTEAEALNGLGEALLATGQPDQACARHYAALTLAEEIGEKHEQARARNGLGAALLAAGQPERAHEQHAAALALAGEIGATPQADRAQAGLLAVLRPVNLAGVPGMAGAPGAAGPA